MIRIHTFSHSIQSISFDLVHNPYPFPESPASKVTQHLLKQRTRPMAVNQIRSR
jgi:hypothetical protein